MPSRITNTDESRPELRQKPTKSGGQTQTEQRNTGREAQNQRRRAKYIPTGPFHVTTDRASKNKKGKERGKGTVNSKHHARSAHQAPPERRQRRKSEGREKKEREKGSHFQSAISFGPADRFSSKIHHLKGTVFKKTSRSAKKKN